MLELRLEKNKRILIDLLSHPQIYKETTGLEYQPKARVHLAYKNYTILYKNHILGLIQLDQFISEATILHGCVLPQYRKPEIIKAIFSLGHDLLRGHVKQAVFTVPSPCIHALRFHKKGGAVEAGRIKNGTTYAGKPCDCILLTLEVH